jgi:pyruvate/2-oxoglutarate dehydrogenase complex dihydrolipoamide acyltransferase (E2) component
METSPGEAAEAAEEQEEAGASRENGGGPRRTAVLVGYGVAEEDERPARTTTQAPERTGPVPATPPVRRLAKDLGVDLAL